MAEHAGPTAPATNTPLRSLSAPAKCRWRGPTVRQRMAQFDIPLFLKTSPLVKGLQGAFAESADALARGSPTANPTSVAGSSEKTNVMVSTQPQRTLALVGQLPLDVVAQLNNNPNSGFFPGPTGVIRAQIFTWNTSADLI